MAKHDIVTYNPTTQGFETDLGENNAEIKGTGNKIFSVESGSTEVFSVGIDNTSITLNSNLTASGDISASALSTGSFGRVIFTKISGDASQLTNVNQAGHVSGAAQVASRISGAFAAGFGVSGSISGSATSTGSFAKVFANTYVGDASQMTNVNELGHFSSSAQLASDISGSFNKGFTMAGTISGSAQSTGSFGRVTWGGQITGNASAVTNLNEVGFVSGSSQLAADISGAFQHGFIIDGTVSGSMTSTASFHTVNASTYVVTNKPNLNTALENITGLISSSAQLATDISQSFNKGFEFTGTISGSATSTGSFIRVVATKFAGNASQITNLTFPTGMLSSSAQIAADISGSFNKGFGYTEKISGSATSTGSFGRVVVNGAFQGDFSAVDAPEQGYISSSAQLATSISGAFDAGFTFGMTAAELSNFSSYVGVSGSTNAYISQGTAHVTMSINSLCGSDFDYRLDDRVVGGIKGFGGYGVGAWSAGPNKIVAASGIGAAGTQNAYLAVGGYTSPSQQSEKYDGSSWAASATLITANCALVGFGTQNAMAIAGGNADTNGTELYNGAAWVNGTDLPHVTAYADAFGTQNAGIVAGGRSGADKDETVSFDGNAYSSLNAMITGRGIGGSAGTQNSGIIAGGYQTPSPYSQNKSETWNGTNWTEVANIITTRRGGTGYGTQNHFIYVGGHNPGYCACTEEWNGTSWSEVNNTITTKAFGGGAGGGLGTAAIHAGGYVHPAVSNTVEFWNVTDTSTGSLSHFKADIIVTKDMTIGSDVINSNISSSFRSHTNKPHIIPYVGDQYFDSRQYVPSGSQLYSCGSCTEFSNGYNNADGQLSIGRDGILNISFQSSSLSVGPGGDAGKTLGAWSAGPNMITGTRGHNSGTQNAAVVATGNTTTGEGPTTSHVQHYNGISWRRGADAIEAKGAVGGGQGYGKSEDDIGLINSYTNGGMTKHIQYNGHSWWYMSKLTTSRRNQGGAGTQNAAVIWGGDVSPQALTEEWNGHSWSESGDLNTGKSARVGAGSQNAAIAGGGANTSQTELYDGTNWSTSNTAPYPAYCVAGMGGDQNDALAKGAEIAATWDGTSWTTVADMPTARNKADVSGNSGLGLVAGGGTANSGTANSVDTTLLWNNSFNTGSFLTTKKIGSNFS